TLRFSTVRARGVDVRVEHLPREGLPLTAGQPAIPGFARRIPRRPPARSDRSAAEKAWTIALPDVRIEEVRELWIERFRTRGLARAEGGFRLAIGRFFELFDSRLALDRAATSVAGLPALGEIEGVVEARIDPLVPGRDSGWRSLSFTSGRARLAGRLASISFLETFLPRAPWLDLAAGDGPLRLEVGLRRGRLVAGSSARIRTRQAVIDLLDYRIRGACDLDWRVDSERAVAEAAIRGAAIGYRGPAPPHLRAPRVQLTLATRDLLVDGRLDGFAATADLPRAEAADLTRYNAFLPPGANLALTAGRGVFSSRLSIDQAGRAAGRIHLQTQGLAVRVRDVPWRGDCRLDFAVRSPDVKARRFLLGGSRGRCDAIEIVHRGARSWWAVGSIDDGFVQPGGQESLGLRGRVEARDAEPVWILFAGPRRAGLAARFLRDKRIAAHGLFALRPNGWRSTIEGAAGSELGLAARLRADRGGLMGSLLARFKGRALGLELTGRSRRVHLRHAEDWFAASSP
ncbi:MAG TPA: hypothetical protein VN783_17815, partial [Thermoanaerobaculia bacterium]|nr:hypothetical protein [Thermoanaerobaculia bacterium]